MRESYHVQLDSIMVSLVGLTETVADSVPELEWRETEAKARALIRAAELVEEGF